MAHLSKLNHTTDLLNSIKSDAISIGIYEDGSMTNNGNAIDTLIGNQIIKAHDRGDIKGKHCETTIFYSEDGPVIVIGLGKANEFETEQLIECVVSIPITSSICFLTFSVSAAGKSILFKTGIIL